MKAFVATIFFALLLGAAEAQDAAVMFQRPTRSVSGQFLVYGIPGAHGPAFQPFYLRTNLALVDLEPWLLVVSCERIKDALWRELNVTAPPTAKVFLFLHRAQSSDDAIVITPRLFADGWNYRVDMPDLVERSRYLSAMTHVLLLTLANQNAGERSAEIPLWLREGLTQRLLVSQGLELIPPPPHWGNEGVTFLPLDIDGRKANALAQAHEVLRANPTWTFAEMSFPSDNDLLGQRGEEFRCSAQLFVARLVSLKNGRDLMRNMIESLPRYYNWQFALLNTFNHYFTRTLDVEKWWAINVVQFTGHDLAQKWPLDESWRQLDDTVRPAIQVRTGSNPLPLHTDTTLQTLIRDGEKSQRDEVLSQTITDLSALKLRLAPPIASLAENYKATLTAYLKDLETFQANADRRSRVGEAAIVRRTLNTLNSLDKRLAALKPQPEPFADPKAGLTSRLTP